MHTHIHKPPEGVHQNEYEKCNIVADDEQDRYNSTQKDIEEEVIAGYFVVSRMG